MTHCSGWAMAKLPPAEQWCVCGVGQPHRRCQDRETLQPSLYTRKYGAMCRLGYLDKRRALYGKKKEEQERRPLTRAQYTSISGIFGVHCSPRSPSSPHIDPDSSSFGLHTGTAGSVNIHEITCFVNRDTTFVWNYNRALIGM